MQMAAAFAARAAYWEGPVPPYDSAELAGYRRQGLVTGVRAFLTVACIEIVITLTVVALKRRAKARCEQGLPRTPWTARLIQAVLVPACLWSILLSAWVCDCIGMRAHYSSVAKLSVMVELVASVLGLWLALNEVPRTWLVLVGCAVAGLLGVFWGPFGCLLLIPAWFVSLLLLFGNGARKTFGEASNERHES